MEYTRLRVVGVMPVRDCVAARARGRWAELQGLHHHVLHTRHGACEIAVSNNESPAAGRTSRAMQVHLHARYRKNHRVLLNRGVPLSQDRHPRGSIWKELQYDYDGAGASLARARFGKDGNIRRDLIGS